MTSPKWRALLQGSDRAQAIDVVRTIVRDLGSLRAKPLRPDACSDVALFLAEASQLEELAIAPREIRRWLDRAVAQLARIETPPWLYGGFLGLGFDLECLRALGATTVAGSDALDRTLLKTLSRPLDARMEYDLIAGLVGVGVYLLARLPRRTARAGLEQLIDRLEERSEAVLHGSAWRTPPRPQRSRWRLPDQPFDLGLAHGTAGVVALLAQLHARGIRQDRTRTLLGRATKWLRRQRLPDSGRFPSHAGAKAPARTAWCYGDPGVAIALYSAARALDSTQLAAAALTTARATSKLSVRAAGVVDACLCHGSAGLAHVYNRLYQASGDDALASAAQLWFRRVLASRQPRRGAAGFIFQLPDLRRSAPTQALPFRPRADRSFLEGSIGVGQALVSACLSSPPRWDGKLLLDLPDLP